MYVRRGQVGKGAEAARHTENMYTNDDSEEDQDSSFLYLKLQLIKGRKGFGFAFQYDKSVSRKSNDISVTKIVAGGVAETDGRLKVGDVIISVNEVDFHQVSYDTGIATLRNSGPKITLGIRRLKENYYEEDETRNENLQAIPPTNNYVDAPNEDVEFEQFTVNLRKRGTGGLGINIQGGFDEDNEDDNDSYISISKLAPNGVADLSEKLQIGDIILQVDYQSLDGVTHEEAIEILQNTGKEVTLYIGRFVEKKKKYRNRRQADDY